MALQNEILVGRFNRFMQKHFGMKGGPPAPQLASEIAMAMQFFYGAENRFTEGWNLFGAEPIQTAVAANNSECRLTNPLTSNVVGVLYRCTALVGGGNFVNVQFGQQAVSGVASVARALDGRVNKGGTTGSTLQATTTTSNSGQIGTTIWIGQGPVNTSLEVIPDTQHEVVLAPGDVFLIQNGVQNSIINVSFWWRERFLEEGERQ